MVTKPISEDSIEAGREFLSTLDAYGLQPETAGWIYAHATGDWRYIVATAAVDVVGRRKLYGGIVDILDAANFGDALTEADIHLVSPNEPWYGFLKNTITFSEGLVKIEGNVINGMVIDAQLYRMFSPPPVETVLKKNSETFVVKARRSLEKHTK